MTRVLDRDLELRRVFGRYPTGVAVLAVSLDPPLVSTCVARTSTTWPVLKRASRFGMSVHRTATAGDHDVVLFSVHRAADDAGALVFHASGYRRPA